jgi:hypothetical protein
MSNQFCNDCISESGETFLITYCDQKGLSFYAILFSAQDNTKAWNPSESSFQTYTLASHDSFSMALSEDSERLGWYSYEISDTTNIPSVLGGQYYFVEVWQKNGAIPSRTVDTNTGNVKVCWGRNEWLEIAKSVWEYGTRELTNFSGVTPQQIWEHTTRTLTSGGVADCDFTELQKHILAAIVLSTGKTIEELFKVNSELSSSIDKTFELLKTCCSSDSKGVPLTQTPRIGPKGSRGGVSDIRFGQ